MASLKVKIGADATQFERTMRGVKSSIGGVKSSILGVAGAAGALMAVNKAFDLLKSAAREAFDFIKDSSQVAASVENLEVQFRVLLGSVTAAKERMEELEKFAASTPFTIPEIAAASKQLQTYGGDLLATGEGLRIVGDAAAVSGVPLQQVAMHAGRLFSALRSGKTAGEALTELQQMGLISAEARIKLEELSATQTAGVKATEKIAKATKYGKEIQQEWIDQQKAGKEATLDAAGAMDILRETLSATEGGMAMLAETTDGKMTMVQDAIFQVQKAFGVGFNDGFKVALDAATEFIPKFKDQMTIAGKEVGKSIQEAVEGDTTRLKAIGQYVGEVMLAGMATGLHELQKIFIMGLEEVNPLRKAQAKFGIFAPKGSESMKSGGDVFSGMEQQARQRMLESIRMADMAAAIRAPIETLPDGRQFRRDPLNQSPIFNSKGERVIELLENINQNTAPKFSTP